MKVVKDVEIVSKKQDVKEHKAELTLGSMNLRKGHTLYEYDVVSTELKPAEFEKGVSADFEDAHAKLETGEKFNKKRRIIKKRGCIYVSALNEKNAYKKIIKISKQF